MNQSNQFLLGNSDKIMKAKVYCLTVIVICVVVVALLLFTKAFCEDDDSFVDVLYINDGASHYYQMPENVTLQAGIIYEHTPKPNPFSSIIAFLERKEKSPPLL